MRTIALVLTLVAGTMGMSEPAQARRMLEGWSCYSWDLNGVNYTQCCRYVDNYCTAVYAG